MDIYVNSKKYDKIKLEGMYMKKFIEGNKKTILFIFALTLLSSVPLIISGTKNAPDLAFHLSRIKAIEENIKNKIFFSGVYSEYINGYGYANGLFYPDIFLYIPAFIKILGFNIITSYKIFLLLINFATIISIYISIKGISKNENTTVIGTIIYTFSSYRLVDMYQRAALGETLAHIFIPIVIYGLYEIIYGNQKKSYILTIGMSGLILSHVISTYMMGIIILVFILLNIKKITKEKRIKQLIISALQTFLITSFFLLPLLEQMKSQRFNYQNMNNLKEFILSKRTVPFYLLFIELPNLRDKLFNKHWVPSGIGIIFIYLIYKKIKSKNIKEKFIDDSYKISIVLLILISIPQFWELNIIKTFLNPIQFPWRFYQIVTLLLTISGSIILGKTANTKKTIKNIFLVSLISLSSITLISTVNRTKEFNTYEIAYGEYLPEEIDLEKINTREKIISDGKTKTKLERKGTTLKIEIEENTGNKLELPLIYYKGYNAYMKKEKLELKKSENGLVEINTNKEKGKIIVKYEGTKLQHITKRISFAATLLFIKKRVKSWEK